MPIEMIDVKCNVCGEVFSRRGAEVRRSLRLGRPQFCGFKCSGIGNPKNVALRAPTITLTCKCGKSFETTSRKRSAKHCSYACATRFNHTEARKEGQRKAGLANRGNLLGPCGALKLREAWKYVKLTKALVKRDHEFEFAIEDAIFDLVLKDTMTLVEFDGPDHGNELQKSRDVEKDMLAKLRGYKVVRRIVEAGSVIPISCLKGL